MQIGLFVIAGNITLTSFVSGQQMLGFLCDG